MEGMSVAASGLGWPRCVQLIACDCGLCSGQTPVDPVNPVPNLACEPYDINQRNRICGDGVVGCGRLCSARLVAHFRELPLGGRMPLGRFPASVKKILWHCKE